ncbi:MAG: hypothetical protein ABIG73_00015 [Patescibacteria group bacterium]
MKNNYSYKKPVRSFRDLEVYQKTLEASVIIVKNIKPRLARLRFPFTEGIVNCAMSVPLWISEAHSIRFGDHKLGLRLLEQAMAGCNKMIVYLEQAKGMYGSKLEPDLMDDLIRRYADVRGKIFRLEKSWQKWTEPKF